MQDPKFLAEKIQVWSLSVSFRSTSLSMQTPWPPTSPRSWTRTNTAMWFPLLSMCHKRLWKTRMGVKNRSRWWTGRHKIRINMVGGKKKEPECLVNGYWFCLLWSLLCRHTHTHTLGGDSKCCWWLEVNESDKSVFRGHPQCSSTLDVFLWGWLNGHYRALSFARSVCNVVETCST